MYLKSFFNKFFFYEIKYFIKNDTILFYFSFKFIRKTFFKFYWNYKYPFYLFSNYPNFKKKKDLNDIQKIITGNAMSTGDSATSDNSKKLISPQKAQEITNKKMIIQVPVIYTIR